MDITIIDSGPIVYIQSLTEAGQVWMDENLAVEPWQMHGAAVACEPRMAADIVEGMRDDGLEVE